MLGLFDDNEPDIWSEGPFVVVNAGGYRIEAQMVGHHCPVMLDSSIYPLKESLGWGPYKTDNLELASSVCDELNAMAAHGQIVLHERGYWHAA